MPPAKKNDSDMSGEYVAICSALAMKATQVARQSASAMPDLNVGERAKLMDKAAAAEVVAQYEALLVDLRQAGVSIDIIPAELHLDLGMCYYVNEAWGKASEQFEVGAEKLPDDHDILHDWGYVLIRRHDETKEIGWLEQGLEKYEAALALKTDLPEALANWGSALWKMYDATADVRWLELADEKFNRAAALNPDHYRAHSNWGGCLATLYCATGDKKWLEAAHQKCMRALEIVPEGVNPYFNPACVLALMEDKNGMLDHLRKAIEWDAVYKKFALEDESFQAYCNDPDFLALVAEETDQGS